LTRAAVFAAITAMAVLVGAGSAHATTFKVFVVGQQDQTYTVSGSSGPCERVGQGGQTVLFATTSVRTNIVKGNQGYEFKASGGRSFALNLPIHEAEISRFDETTRTPGPCDTDSKGNPVPLPPKDCRDDVSIASTMMSLQLFLGKRPTLEGGYFFLNEDAEELEPFSNCLAFARPDSFHLIGEGFFDVAKAPKLPGNLLNRRKWKGTAKGSDLFDSGLASMGTSIYTANGETIYGDIDRVGPDRAVAEDVSWTVYLKRVGGGK
jgi:hypothetical protein